jgi:hypothetical protein
MEKFIKRFGDSSSDPESLARQLGQILESLLRSLSSEEVSSFLQETAMNAVRDQVPSLLMEFADRQEQMANAGSLENRLDLHSDRKSDDRIECSLENGKAKPKSI